MASANEEFSNDLPLRQKADDKLNRAPFAERIAGVLRDIRPGGNMVIGIHGPWGDGKTTVLNLIRAELEATEAAIVLEFNPWRFTDEPAMLRGFFGALAETIRAKITTKAEDIAGWIEEVGQYAAWADGRLEKIVDVAGKKASAGLETLRLRLSDALSKSGKRIVVLVDDIDRLDKHETYTLFRLIKACADFPNVCYVLAFDDVAVARSLGERYGNGDEASGRAFLEKIIQVPLKLPVAAKEDLRALCFAQVESALNAAGIELSREEVSAFISGFDHGVSAELDTPRAAKRYGNGLMFSLPMLKGEVNTVDLLLLEALRAFYPSAYECVRSNQEDFCGVEGGRAALKKDERPRAETLLKPILESMDSESQGALKSLIMNLFPRAQASYRNMSFGSEWVANWTKGRRVSSPDYCPRYFSYAIPRNDIRDSEIESLVESAAKGKTDDVQHLFERHLADGRAARLIEKLRAGEDNVATEAARSLSVALARAAKLLPNHPAWFSPGQPPSQAGILISHLICRLPPGDARVALAKDIVESADPLWFGAESMRWMNVTHDADKAEANALTDGELNAVRETLVTRVKQRAKDGHALFDSDVPQEQLLLFEWRRREGRDPVQAHLRSVFQNDSKKITAFLATMAPRAWGMGDALPRIGDLDSSVLKNIEFIYDLDELLALIREHCPGDFEDPQRFHDHDTPVEKRLAEQFVLSYKAIREKEASPATEANSPEPNTEKTSK